MGTKNTGKVTASAKTEATKETKKSAPKKGAKPEKGDKHDKLEKEILPVQAADGAPVDPDELEEQEDAAAAAGSNSGNAAALAAASGPTEMSASFKNFRHHPDMENFYRFIYDNDLRHEALAIIDTMISDKTQKKPNKGGKPH